MIERQKLMRMTERSERMYLKGGKISSQLERDQRTQSIQFETTICRVTYFHTET